MRRFDVIDARSLREAAILLGRHGARAHRLAGGGDLFPLLWNTGPEQERKRARVLVNLASIPGLGRIHYERSEGLALGAMVTVADIQADRTVREKYLGVAQAAAAGPAPPRPQHATRARRPHPGLLFRIPQSAFRNGDMGTGALDMRGAPVVASAPE